MRSEQKKWFVPLAVYYSSDGGEWIVRDYAGQSGRFCVLGPYTVDVMASFGTLARARAYIVDLAGEGSWDPSPETPARR